jgi:hypothetical protein
MSMAGQYGITRVGDRYRCFIAVRKERGWSGPWGQTWNGAIWRCEVCGFELREWAPGSWAQQRAADHHECGHAPCERCGQMLLLRKDGTPRQHAHNRCAGKNPGFRIEREFAKNIIRREVAS